MDLGDGGAFWFELGGGDLVNSQSSGKCMPPQSKQIGQAMLSSMAISREDPSSVENPCFPANVAEQFLASDWNPFISMAQHVDFNGFPIASSPTGGIQENEGISSSGGNLMDQIPSLPFFKRKDIPESNSCALSSDGQITGAVRPDFNSGNGYGIVQDSKQKKRRIIECGAFDFHSPFSRIQTAKDEPKEDVLPGSLKSPREEGVKKERGEHNPETKTDKPTSKQAEENSWSGDAPKEDYIHLRAKRGQATNSHSLAERVRRQKISERMRFLQDLVPGCSKITGKAVMLDEIINYIQSLQRQVEFLSMKLATVNPDLNFEIGQILSKDILHSKTGGLDFLGFCPGFSTSHPHFQMSIFQEGIMQVEMAIDNKSNSTKVTKDSKCMQR